MDRRKILLDIGGSFIKCDDGRCTPVDSSGSREEISVSFREAVSGCKPGDMIGVAIPGPFDYNKGIFLMKHKFASVYGERFNTLAGLPDGVETHFVHDVVCMLRGEMVAGAGKPYRNVALISLGTGLGFAMAVDRKIQVSPSGTPAVSIYNQPFKDGILEDYASKRGILRAYQEAGGTPVLSVKDIGDRAESGEDAAKEVFRWTGEILSGAVKEILDEYDVECLLFGGQISHAFDYLSAGFGSSFSRLQKVATVSDFKRATFNGLDSFIGEF